MNRRTEAIVPLTADQKALATRHAHLCNVVAMRFGRRHPGLYHDFRGAAAEGLCDAARKFDGSMGARFSTYAHHRMVGACLDMMRTNGLVRGRRADRYETPAVLSIDRDYGGGARATGEAREAYQAIRWSEFILPPAAVPDPSDRLAAADQFEGWLRFLPEREKTLMRLHYGPDRMTLRGVALVLGISESRVLQIHTSILGRLRKKAHLPRFRALLEA